VRAFVSSGSSFVRGFPASHVKSAKANGSAGFAAGAGPEGRVVA